jgi:tetratricopeptide (TPR) repeat protein
LRVSTTSALPRRCHARNLLRQATAQYERTIALDPAWDKIRYQLMHAKATLGEPHEAIAEHRRRLAEAPRDVREHRLLAYALLVAHEYRQAADVVAAGLRLDDEDRKLVEFRGDARAGLNDPDGTLADWRHAVELDPTDIGPWYSSAYLLEREHRIGEAIGVWRQILKWNRARDNTMDVEWATRELHRLHPQRAGDPDSGR